MDIAKVFGTDKDAEQEGVWIPIGSDGARVRVAREGNPHYTEVVKRLRRPYANFRAGQMPDDVALDIYRKANAEAILLGWEGIKLDGKELPYSVENALRLFKEYPDFLNMIASASQSLDNFRKEADEELAKNSSRSSSTSKAALAA